MSRQRKAKVLMVQGTGSSVGKSLIVTGLCRLFAQDGYRVAPFKAQNMSLNSGVTPDGFEIGRAQLAQAQAAGVQPRVEMNPVLLKPEGNATSQLVLMGKMDGEVHARDFLTKRERLWSAITESLDTLRTEFDIVVIEGAGSPAEINLRAGDIVNMEVALYADAPVLIVGDIDKGGVFASLYGTHKLISEQERKLVKGFIINKFRGDVSLLESGIEELERLTCVDVVGVLPYLTDVYVPEEDSPMRARMSGIRAERDRIEVAIIALPHIANFDEFDPLARMSGVELRYVRSASDFGDPDLVILPGTKTTAQDLYFVRQSGMATMIRSHLLRGRAMIGICGGLQMLGKRINDPDSIESDRPIVQALGILDIETTFSREKTTTLTDARIVSNEGLLTGMADIPVSGYEIHVGDSHASKGTTTAIQSIPDRHTIGYIDSTGRIFGSYMHGLFENENFAQHIITNIARMSGIHIQHTTNQFSQNAEYDKLANHLRNHLDLAKIYQYLNCDVNDWNDGL